MAITQDGYASNTGNSNAGGTVTLSTTNAGDIIVLCVFSEDYGHASGTVVTGVSSANTTGWTWRASVPAAGLSGPSCLDVWYGKAAAPLSSEVITLTLTAAVDGWAALCSGFSGVDQVTPWDANGSLPASGINSGATSTPAVSGVSTSALNTMLLAFSGSPTYQNALANPGSAPSGFSGMGAAPGGYPPGYFTNCYGAFQAETAAQSGLTITFSGRSAQYVSIADALRAAGTAAVAKSSAVIVGF